MTAQPLTIALDARAIHRARRRGTGKSLIDLYRQVLRHRPDWRVIGYHRGPEADPLDRPGYQPRLIESLGDRIDAWRRWRMPMAAWRDGADLMHFPANLAPGWVTRPTMVTIHDLLPLGATGPIARRFERSVRRSVRLGLTLITPSQYTADRLVADYHADPARIVVNPWAPDSGMRPVADPAEREAVCRRYGVSGPFVLHLGAPDPRKNTRRVVEAFARLPVPMRREWSMLVVGLDDPEHRRRIASLCREQGVAGAVHLAGFADEQDMPALFTAADLLLYTSLGEGFGLPILDAWAVGTAVLTSDNTSLGEVGGDAVVYADADDTDQIADRLGALLRDAAWRDRMRDAGRRRLQNYTWAATAQRYITTVETTLARHSEVRRESA